MMKHIQKLPNKSVGFVGLCLVLLTRCGRIEGETVVNCSAQNYPSKPCSFPPDTTTLDLSHNNIEKILRQDFSGIRQLKKLYLQFNQINNVDPLIFQDNPELEYLDISNNQLLEISALPFTNLPVLKHLDISNNPYDNIQLGDTFALLRHLQVLKLGNPDIVSFGKDSFQGLSGLALKEFHLITGDFREYEPRSLKVLHDLEKITLEVNMWQNIDVLLTMGKDIVNSTKALKLANLDLLRIEKVIPIYDIFLNSDLKSFTLQNISTDGNYCTPLLTVILNSRIEELTLDTLHTKANCTPIIHSFEKVMLKRFSLKNLDNPKFIFFLPQPTMKKFLEKVQAISVINCGMFFLPCLISDSLLSMETLDLSNNTLQEETLFPRCNKPFPALKSLVIDTNTFLNLSELGNYTSHMKYLVNFSASDNKIVIGSQYAINWTRSLKRLNLRGNQLSDDVFMYLPDTLEVLDISYNAISVIANVKKMNNLVELYLSGNKILSLADLSSLSSLRLLYVDRNKITGVTVEELSAIHLTELKFSYNPFDCNCNIRYLSRYCQSTSVAIVDWPKGYRCETPESLKDRELQSVSIPWASCNKGAFACIMLVQMVVTILIIWYAIRKWKRRNYSQVLRET
ncbi:toll-like receptor 2 [Amia ocellicauda]|uniref:toll-like receptor 2 n=1 Tax=Amia ocellicauda TaxID=2972642 RepID=UPI0034643DC3